LRTVVDVVSDITVHFLADRVDRDLAILVGIDHALGDWVVILTPTAEEIAALPRVFAKAGPFEIVFAGAPEPAKLPLLYRKLAGWYFRLYEVWSGSPIEWPPPQVRVYSRAAARCLANSLDGEFMLRSLAFSGAFPGTRVVLDAAAHGKLPSPKATAWMIMARKALRGLFTASAVTMRATIGVALITAILSVLGALYAVGSYLFKLQVEPGWTTLSLQISLMMLLFSLMFALLSEYVLTVYRKIAPRRRILVVREIRSRLRRQRSRLNVIGGDGSFRLGAPANNLVETSKVKAAVNWR
jgi:hypothetical protein